jgi:hypothetical protein
VFQVMDPEEGQHSVCPVATLEARECDPRETGKWWRVLKGKQRKDVSSNMLVSWSEVQDLLEEEMFHISYVYLE